MYIVKPASLDDWGDLVYLSNYVRTHSKHNPKFERAVECVDFSKKTLGSYLVNSLASRVFHFYLLANPAGEVAGFITFTVQQMPDLKNPGELVNAGFIPSMYSKPFVPKEETQKLVGVVRNLALTYKCDFIYGNVKKTGAYTHFLEHHGAEEISRTLYVRTEDLK